MLSLLGLLGIYRVDSQMAFKQWLWVLLGLGSFVLIMILVQDYRKLEAYKFIFMLVAIFSY